MTPFDTNPDNDAGHTIDQDDLIAFHLHELPSPQERAVRRVLHTDPSLQAESLAIASTLRAFPKHEAALPLDPAALDRHWLALRDSLPLYVAPAVVPRSFFPRWAFPALAGSVLATAALILALHHSPRTNPPIVANLAPPEAPTVPSEVIPSENAVQPNSAVPTHPFTPPISISEGSFPTNPAPHTEASTPSTPNNAQTVIAPPPAQAPSATTQIATTQQPTSFSSNIPPIPTAFNRTHPTPRPHYDRTTDLTLAALGNFTPDRSFTTTTGVGSSAVVTPYSQTATPTVGVLAAFHQQFRSWLGYRITATHSEPTFEYTYSPPSGGSAGITVPQNAYELSATYVVRGPRHRQVSTYAETGAGVLAFHPTNPNSALGVGNVLRSTAVFGISADLALTRHWAIHAGYRALLYKSPPAYVATGFDIPTAGNLTFSNEPVLGLTYRFHPTREE